MVVIAGAVGVVWRILSSFERRALPGEMRVLVGQDDSHHPEEEPALLLPPVLRSLGGNQA